jgi:hypothetical protein
MQETTRFEASGLTFAKGYAWVVFDNLRTLGRVEPHFNYMGADNLLTPDLDEPEPGPEDEENSQFEVYTFGRRRSKIMMSCT